METTVSQSTTHNHVELTGKSRQVRRGEERKRNKPKLIKPEAFDTGLREAMASIDVPLLISMKDVFFNHHQDHLDKDQVLKTHWIFTLDPDNKTVCRLERLEFDGSGKGMTNETVAREFTRTLKERMKSEGGGIHSVGEKLFYELCIKYNRGLAKRGIEVITKTDDMDEYYWQNYNPTDDIVINQDYLTYDDALGKGLPVDKVGEQGTYTSMYFSTEGLEDNWFEQFCAILNLYFSVPFSKPWKATLEFDKSDAFKSTVVELEGAVIPAEGGGANPGLFRESIMDFYGKDYKIETLVRPAMGTDESRKFDQKYGDRRAFKTSYGVNATGVRNGNIGDNLVIMICDKKHGWAYDISVINSGAKQRRGVMKIFVDRNKDLQTDVAKAVARLSSKDEFKSKGAQNKKILETWADLYPVVDATEQQLRNQIVNILHGIRWPETFTYPMYKELCEVFECPVGDYQWAKKHIITHHPVLQKNLDIYNSNTNHIFELKKNEPDGDNDLNQIICYQSIVKADKVTMVAVSRSKKAMVTTIDGEFNPDKRSLYTSQLENEPNLSHVEWNLVDLRYFGLHDVSDKFKEVQ